MERGNSKPTVHGVGSTFQLLVDIRALLTSHSSHNNGINGFLYHGLLRHCSALSNRSKRFVNTCILILIAVYIYAHFSRKRSYLKVGELSNCLKKSKTYRSLTSSWDRYASDVFSVHSWLSVRSCLEKELRASPNHVVYILYYRLPSDLY